MPKTQDLFDLPHSILIHGPCSQSTVEASNVKFILIDLFSISVLMVNYCSRIGYRCLFKEIGKPQGGINVY